MWRMALGLAVVAGCGDVDSKKKIDAAVGDSQQIDSPVTDAGADAGLGCMTDDFAGGALGSHWTVTAGAAPTYTVAVSAITVTDAPIVSTPSNTDESWINEADTDRGNQLSWAQPIGAADFIVRSHLNWTSSTADLMIAGIAVTETGTGRIVALAGFNDGTVGGFGGPWALIAAPGADATTLGTTAETGSIDLRIERTSSVLKVFIAGVEILSSTDSTSIGNVALVNVPYRQVANNYTFGTAQYTSVEVCR